MTSAHATSRSAFVPSCLRASVPVRGFTLVELMISIALVLLLMVGINQVFKVTGETVGTSQTIAEGVRDARAAQSVMGGDIGKMVTESESPCLLLRSQRIAAFRNRADELADRDYAAVAGTTQDPVDRAIRTIDLDGDGAETTGTVDEIPRAILGARNRRIDQISFFARGNFPRQTGNDGEFIADMSSNEAWITYGHLKQPGTDPNDASGYQHLGTGVADTTATPLTSQNNPSNFFSSQWILGRMVMLLRAPDTSSGFPGEIEDNSTPPRLQTFIARSTGATAASVGPLGLTSVAYGSSAAVPPPATGDWRIGWSRFDLAGTTIADFKTILTNAFPVNATWYSGSDGLIYRFQGSLIPNKPLTSEGLARVSPTLLENCSQFIVEYAGDFLTQDNDPLSSTYGYVQTTPVGGDPLRPDGEIDVVVNPVTRVKSIRWYGFPRDTSSNNAANPGQPDGRIVGVLDATVGTFGANALCDVVPLRDVALTTAIVPAGYPGYFPFERDLADPQTGLPARADYASKSAGLNLRSRYECVWGPDLTDLSVNPAGVPTPYPAYIRFVYTIDDPTGRIAEGQTFEYVFKVGN